MHKLDAQPGSLRVLVGELERVERRVHGDHLDAVDFVRERESDRAGARPDIEHPWTSRLTEELDADLDDGLRLRSRHECTCVAVKRQTAKAPFAEDVGEGLADGAPFNQGPDGCVVDVVAHDRQLGSGDAEDVRNDPLGVRPRRLDSVLREQHCRPLHDHSSARRRSSACNASVKLLRSPPTIWSSRCSVSLMR